MVTIIRRDGWDIPIDLVAGVGYLISYNNIAIQAWWFRVLLQRLDMMDFPQEVVVLQLLSLPCSPLEFDDEDRNIIWTNYQQMIYPFISVVCIYIGYNHKINKHLKNIIVWDSSYLQFWMQAGSMLLVLRCLTSNFGTERRKERNKLAQNRSIW